MTTPPSLEAITAALGASMGARLLPEELRLPAAELMRRLAGGRPASLDDLARG